MRAAAAVVLGLAVLGGCRTCIDPDVPRNYLCTGDGGAAECPGGWQCNATWGFCFNPDAGSAVPCRVDSECGGGWRCTPDGVCGNPANEGDLSTIEVLEPVPLHPRLFTRPTLQLAASAPLRGEAARGPTMDSALAGRLPDGGLEILTVHAELEPEGDRYETTWREVPLQALDFAMSVGRADAGPEHFLWYTAGGRLYLGRDAALPSMPAPGLLACTWVAPLRTAGAVPKELSGAVQVRHGAGLALVSPFGQPLPGIVGPSAQEALWLGEPACPGVALVVVARSMAIEAYRLSPDGGVALAATASAQRPGDFRVAQEGNRTWVAWRELAAGVPPQLSLKVTDVGPLCGDGGTVTARPLQRPVCPQGTFVGYDLLSLGDGPAFVTECVEWDPETLEPLNDLVFVGERVTPEAYLPPRIVTRDSEVVFSRFEGGQLSSGPNLLVQEPLTLPQPPEALLPGDDGGLRAYTRNASFRLEPWGLMVERVEAWEGVPAAYVEAEGLIIARSGVVTDFDQSVVALPEAEWINPSAWVLSDVLPQSDGGFVLVAAHDDAFDVAELEDDTPTLVTRLRPSPATPILSMALQPARDGGTAEGYLVAGLDLFEVRAPTPRRWSASPVSLSGLRPVFTWFDQGRPRALLDDGTVLGLSTRVPLSLPLEEEVRAGGALCGAPFALTASGLWTLYEAAGGASARYEWGWVDLPGADDRTDFSRGRLVALDGQLYVFANSGAAWSVTPASDCPAP